MACKNCRAQARLLAHMTARPASPASAPTAAMRRYLTTQGGTAGAHAAGRRTQARSLSSTAPRALLDSFGSGPRSAYLVVGATERLYKVCGEAAAYKITEKERKEDSVAKLEDGEEVGQSIAKSPVWHGRKSANVMMLGRRHEGKKKKTQADGNARSSSLQAASHV